MASTSQPPGSPPASSRPKRSGSRSSRPSLRPARQAPPSTRRRSRRPTPSPRRRWIVARRLLLLAVVVLAASYIGFVFAYGRSRGPGTGREVDLDWPAGLSAEEAAERLGAAGLVTHPHLFALYLRLTGAGSDLRPGRHLVSDDLSPRALVRRMQRALVEERAKVLVPEGYTRFDIAKRLQIAKICAAKAFLDATTDTALLASLGIAGPSAEGYLFPATYEFALDSEPSHVVFRMKGEFDKRYLRMTRENATAIEALRTRFGWGTAEIVTLASIVEKEAALDEERPLIASVFLNRLRDPTFMPKRLQSDPTSGYGCLAMPERINSCRFYNGRVTPEINADDSNPYTTYRHEGLPPGPIANPGEKSLQAVIIPAESRYLYFVARGEGRHTFSETYGQHNDAIRHNRSPP